MSKSEATAAFQNIVFVISFFLKKSFCVVISFVMQALTFRAFRKDNIYFRKIEEREKINVYILHLFSHVNILY